MQKVKHFFDILWRSLTDREYYAEILRSSFSFSAKYLLLLLFILSFVSILRMVLQFLPNFSKVEQGIQDLKTTMGTLYPEGLVLTISKGQLSTNVKEPFFLDLPIRWMAEIEEMGKHFVAIDTRGSPEDFPKYESAFLVTKSTVVFKRQNDGYQMQPLSDLKQDMTIDKKSYDALVSKLTPYLNTIQPLIGVFLVLAVFFGPILFMFFGFIGKLTYLLFATLILFLVAKITNVQHTYKELYRLSMHGITLPILVNYVLSVFGLSVPFLFTILYLGWMTVVLLHLRKSKPAIEGPPPMPTS